MPVSHHEADARQYVRFELRWPRTDAGAAELLPGEDSFCCVRCAVELSRESVRPTVGELKLAISDRLRSVADAELNAHGRDLPTSVAQAVASLRGRLQTADDLVLLAPVSSSIHGGEVAATPLFDHQELGHAIPPTCRQAFPFEVTRFDDLWHAAAKPDGVLVEGTHADLLRHPDAEVTSIVSTAGVHAPYSNIQARIDGAIGAAPRVRALSTAVLVRFRKDVQPLLIHDPMVLARAFDGTAAAVAFRKMAQDVERQAPAVDNHPDDENDDDPAEIVRRQIRELQALKVREHHTNTTTAVVDPVDAAAGDEAKQEQQAAWPSCYGRPAWFRVVPRDGSEGLVRTFEPTPGERVPPKRATHIETELNFVKKYAEAGKRRPLVAAAAIAAGEGHEDTADEGSVLLTHLQSVPRPSAVTSATVDSLCKYLQPYAELAAEEHRLAAVDTVLTKTTFTVSRVEYLDADFSTFVLATPSTVANAAHRLTRALRVTVDVTCPTYRQSLAGFAARRKELLGGDDAQAEPAGFMLGAPPVVACGASNTSPGATRGQRPPRPPSAAERSDQQPATGSPRGGSRQHDETPLQYSQSLLAQMSTRTRTDALAAIALSVKPEEQEELDSGRRDDDVGFLAHVMSAGLVNLVAGGGGGGRLAEPL